MRYIPKKFQVKDKRLFKRLILENADLLRVARRVSLTHRKSIKNIVTSESEIQNNTQQQGNVSNTSSLWSRTQMFLRPHGDRIITLGAMFHLTGLCMPDILYLRLLGICSSVCSITFTLTRENPFYVSAMWSTVFMAVNGLMISKLLYDRQDVKFSDNDMRIYETWFLPHGLTPRQFCKLMKISTIKYVPAGSPIFDATSLDHNKTQDIVLILSGDVQIAHAPPPSTPSSQFPSKPPSVLMGGSQGSILGAKSFLEATTKSKEPTHTATTHSSSLVDKQALPSPTTSTAKMMTNAPDLTAKAKTTIKKGMEEIIDDIDDDNDEGGLDLTVPQPVVSSSSPSSSVISPLLNNATTVASSSSVKTDDSYDTLSVNTKTALPFHTALSTTPTSTSPHLPVSSDLTPDPAQISGPQKHENFPAPITHLDTLAQLHQQHQTAANSSDVIDTAPVATNFEDAVVLVSPPPSPRSHADKSPSSPPPPLAPTDSPSVAPLADSFLKAARRKTDHEAIFRNDQTELRDHVIHSLLYAVEEQDPFYLYEQQQKFSFPSVLEEDNWLGPLDASPSSDDSGNNQNVTANYATTPSTTLNQSALSTNTKSSTSPPSLTRSSSSSSPQHQKKSITAVTDATVLIIPGEDVRDWANGDVLFALPFTKALSASLVSRVRLLSAAHVRDTYFHMLRTCVQDGKVDESEKEALKIFRDRSNIKQKDHEECLQVLGWSLAEFDAGHLQGHDEDKSLWWRKFLL
eukprot:GDKK01064492.1.p1 GENE.GDKK01064492.1~~GDKK01064492.1.p1  ORF type:complete len:744 (-),score=175.63 GDKK01064492.1:82-2313(-)